MALSKSILDKIKQDKEEKKNKKGSGNSSATSSVNNQGSESDSSGYSISKETADRVALDLTLKKQGFTHHRETGLLNDSRYKDYYNSVSSVDDKYVSSFLSDWNSYSNRLKTAYDGMSWKSAQEWGLDKSYEETGKDLMFRSAMIRTYLDSHKDDLDWNSYKMLTSQLDNIQKTKIEFDTAFSDAKSFYSQWDTEDAYNKWKKDTEEYEALKSYDIEAGSKEITEFEKQVSADEKEYWNLYELRTSYSTGAALGQQDDILLGLDARMQEILDKYGAKNIDEVKGQLTQKKQKLNLAKHIQEGITLAGVIENDDFKDKSGYVSTKDDSTWSKLTSDFGMGYDDLTYEYINGEESGMRQEIINKAVSYDADTEKFFVYDHMTDDQIATYNYYYAKNGKDAAEKYLKSIQETLNYQAAAERYEKMEGKTALELLFGIEAGVDQFQSGIKNLFNTEDDYIAQSSTQMVSGMVREDLADNGAKLPDWLGGASIAQAGYDAITTTSNMAPSIMTSAVLNIIAPGSGAVVGSAMMGASAAGNAYQEMLNLGYDKNQARAYSTLVGASEAGLQYLLGGISQLGGKVSGNVLTKMMNGIDNAFLRTALQIGGNMLSEGFEEGLQEILTPWFQNLVMHTDEDINWSEVAYSTLLGALTAGVMEGPTTIGDAVSVRNTGKQLQTADISATRLAEIGKTFSADTVAYQLAGKVDENTGAYTMGRLFNEIGATLSEQNVTDITNALVAKGMDQETAKKNAEVLSYVVEGGQFSDADIAKIEINEVLAEVTRETLFDANTTWNQRTNALKTLADEMTAPKTAQAKTAQQSQENAPTTDTVDTQNNEAVQGLSEAETVDTSPAKVQTISSIENGQVTVKLEDGTEINVKEADLSVDDGVRIETIAKLEGISATDANFILNTLRTNTSASAQMDSLGAREAYKYGFYGFSDENMTTHGVFSNSLTESQRKAIYETGRAARQRQVEAKQAAVAKNTTTSNKDSNKVSGKVHFEGDRTTLTERQSASLTAMEKVADALGVQIYVFESEVNERGQRVGANGWYDPKDNSIHIDLHAGANGEGTMLFTAAHELTHFIRQWSPAKFKTLADFLMQEYGKKGVNVDALVREQMNKAKRNGRTISYDTAYEEVVADSMEMMLSDGKVMEKLAKLKAQDKSLWQKIKDFINEMAVKIRAVYEGMAPDSVEGRHVAEMVDAIERLQDLFTEGLVEASENFQSAEKNTTQEGGVDYEAAVLRSDRIVDQIRSSLHKIMALDSVYTIDSSNATPYTADRKTDEKSGNDVFKAQGGVANRSGFGRVVLSKRGAVQTVHHGNGPAKQAAFPAIKAVIEQGIEIYRDNNHNDQGYDTITFSAPITFFGEEAPLAVVVKSFESVNADKTFYIHEICDAEGNYIQMAEEYPNKKTSSTNFVEPTSTVSTADDGISPKTNIAQPDAKINSGTEEIGMEIDSDTESVAPAILMSERTWTESDYVQERDTAAKEIAKAIGVSEKNAKAYIDSVNSIAKMIADDRVRLDYFSSPGRSSFVGNVEYGGSFDFSTLCKKRRLLTGTFTAIQKALPNTALTANEILDIRNRMKDAGLEVSCGLCYVEGSRANMGQFAKEFLRLYKQYYPDAWQPNMADVNTPDGIEWVRINHPEAYEQYEYFWNHYGTLKPGDKNLFASQQKPKLYQLHTEYKGEILEKFNDDENVEEKNLNGGIRLQSFSDFEIVHLIDTMQIIMDMSRVGLAGQAYTKVPDFAWALGDTGLKINLSLIAKGVDENGKLIFDDVEGMPIADAIALRDRYSKNVGTILVAFNDEQLLAAMADDRVDYIIPFHRSQWKKSQYAAMGLPAKTKDYTYMQNEKFIKPQYHEYRGRMVKDKATNYMPNEYWDFSKSGKQNAEAYLEMCARNNKRPKFYKLLQNNGDGSYSLKADGSTDGYWKLLIDFKMYDNEGNGSPQMPVKPDFNMDEATRMLNDYSGGHSNFPVAQGIVDDFVKEYKDSHKGVKFSDRDSEGNQLTEDQHEYFEKSMARDRDGRLQVVYHGGTVKFEFDTSRGAAGKTEYGPGGYFTESEFIAKQYSWARGGNVKEYYLNIERMFDDTDMARTVQMPQWQKLEQILKHNGIEEKYIQQFREYGFGYMRRYLAIKAGDRRSDNWSGSEQMNAMLREAGFDGVKGPINDSIQYVIFTPNQAKLTTNEVPSGFYDTRYSDRDTESVSNRSLLANAFEGVAQNDIERQKIQEYKGKISLIESEERKLSELNQQIKDLSFAKGPKDTKAIRDLQYEAKQTANRISTFDKQLLRLEASKPLQDVLQREKKMAYQRAEKKGKDALEAYREKTMKTQRELIEKWQDSRKKGIESRQRTAMRHKIKDVVNELNQYLLRGTKDRHVPIELQKAVAEALDAVNMDTVGADERIAKLQAELMKAKTPEKIQEISRKIDHVREMGDKMNNRLKKLKDAYDQFVNSDDPMIANSHDEVISNKLQSVIESVGDTPLRDMTVTQLEDVYDMYRMVLTTIRNTNKAFKAKKSESISVIAGQVMMEVEKVGGKKKLSRKGTEGIKSFAWNNLKPVYAFEHIGSDHFTEVFNNVRAGEDVWALDVTEAREFYLDKSKKHGYDSWDFKKRYKFTSTSGMDLELDLEQIMSLYAYSKREQAAEHLKKGGIVIDETTEITVKNKLGIPVKFNPTEATAYNISDATLAEIISKLTNDQKDFVDVMQDYLSTVMGAKGNEVSLEMYGVKLFKEKFYFPLKSAQQFMAKAKEQQKGEVKIKNSGFSKETVQKASNPIVLTPFMNVWADHVNEMSMYHAFVLPMEDFYRVYNYKTPTSDTMATESVEMFIQNAYGKGATKYIDQLLKDLNGGARTDHTTGIINKMMGLFKKGAVFASLSVVVQQPSAIARAAALVDTKYFIGPKVDHKKHKVLWDEVKQYAPVAVIKEMGYFDTNMGKSTQDFILGKEYSGFKDKMKALFTDSGFRDEALSKAPALADEIAWCSIWEAVKRETKAKYPGLDTKAEPFLKLCGSRFTEVIVKTQVYDSVLSRSGLMRSKDTGMKMATAFMAEPTTSINMVADALLKGKRGNRKYARGAIGAVIASQILNSILVSFVYAGRDDDEDETYWEKYIGTLSGQTLDSLNPAGYIPFIKDIMSIVQGYDVERSDMAVISDLWKAIENLKKDTVSPYRKVEGFVGSIAQIFGLPVKNLMRDARGIYQTIDSFVNGQQTTKAGIGYAVKGAITGKTVSNDQQLYEAILNGDQTQIARVKGRFKDQTAINNAIRKALRENDPRIHDAAVVWNANDLDEYMRIAKQIIGEKYFSQDDVVMAIRSEASKLAPSDGSSGTSKAKGLFTAEKFAEAIAQGDQATANAIKTDIIQTHQKNGKTAAEAEKSFASTANGDLKEMFLAGEINESRAIQALTNFCGESNGEAEQIVSEWRFEDQHGFTYSDRGDAYKSGAISAQELKDILMTTGGKTSEEADLQIKVYDWQSEGFDIDSDQTKIIERYEGYCEPAGIDKATYYDFYQFYNESGEEGVSYSKTIECMPYIDSLPLSASQKTAIALSIWAESTVRKYKTW